jgi:hypothetical protein
MTRHKFARKGKTLSAQTPLAKPKATKRRERRYAFPIPIIVFGFDSHGSLFVERAIVRNVSRRGCCIHLSQKPQDPTLAVQAMPREGMTTVNLPHVLYEIVWLQEVNHGWDVGAFALSDTSVLDLAFPSNALGPFLADKNTESSQEGERS